MSKLTILECSMAIFLIFWDIVIWIFIGKWRFKNQSVNGHSKRDFYQSAKIEAMPGVH